LCGVATLWGVPVPERNGDKSNHQLEELALIESCFGCSVFHLLLVRKYPVEDVRSKTPQSHGPYKAMAQVQYLNGSGSVTTRLNIT